MYVFNNELMERNRRINSNRHSFDVIDSKNKYSGEVCIVSAGASLKENIYKLQEFYRQGIPVFCIDKSLNFLKDNGVFPTACASIDPKVFVPLNFSSSLIKLYSLKQCNPPMVNQFGNIIFCDKNGNPPFDYSDTVANFAFGLCHYLGFSRFCLFGFDFVIKDNIYSLPDYRGKGITQERRKIVYYEGDKQVSGEVSYALWQGYKSLRKYIAKYGLKDSVFSHSDGLPIN